MGKQRRMIYASIYANSELNMLPLEARYLYIGTLVLADDGGKLRADARYLRGQIFSFDEKITSNQVEEWLKLLSDVGQIVLYRTGGVRVLKHPKWKEYQRIRADLYNTRKLPDPLRDRNVAVTPAYRKRREENRIERNRREEKGAEYLTHVPEGDVKEFLDRFLITEREVRSKAEDLKLYCERKGRRYKNYRSFLLNALKKDFKERDPTQKVGKYVHT